MTQLHLWENSPCPLPDLHDAEIAWVIQHVAEYVEQQRQTYRGRAGRAVSLDGHQRSGCNLWWFLAAPHHDSEFGKITTGKAGTVPSKFHQTDKNEPKHNKATKT